MQKVSNQFRIGKSLMAYIEYVGPVVLSESALYLVPKVRVNDSDAMRVHYAVQGGLIGALVGTAIHKAIDKAIENKVGTPTLVCFRELNGTVKMNPVWGDMSPDLDVIVVPREAVVSVQCSLMRGITIGGSEGDFMIPLAPWKVLKVKGALAEYGWPTG